MLGAGTVINPIIKLVTTVAILAAAYFFIVKPILDTTDRAFDAVSPAFEGFDELPGQVQDQVGRALDRTDGSTRLQGCVERALREPAGQQARIDRCLERFAR